MAGDDETNEILAATHAAKRHRDAAAKTPEPSGMTWPVAAAGVAIGSAALAAALLYANRKRK